MHVHPIANAYHLNNKSLVQGLNLHQLGFVFPLMGIYMATQKSALAGEYNNYHVFS